MGAVRLARLLAEAELQLKQTDTAFHLPVPNVCPTGWIPCVLKSATPNGPCVRCWNVLPWLQSVTISQLQCAGSRHFFHQRYGGFVGSLQRWGPALRRLKVLLNASDMEAMELHTEMLNDARVAALPEWQPLHQAMNVLDFEQAQNAVHHLRRQGKTP